MKVPVEIRFRRMRSSAWIEAELRKRTQKLTTCCRHILACRVLVEIPHRHHETGNRFHCSVDVTVPGEEIAVTRGADVQASSRRLTWVKVIHRAFDVARRRLQDYNRKRRGEVKTHSPVPRTRKAERVAS